jgi:hypothetical protein
MIRWRRRQLVGWLSLGALLSACSPRTQNVRAFTTSVADTYDDLGPVLEMGYPSCVKAAEYHMLKEASIASTEEERAVATAYAKRLQTCDQTKIVQGQVVLAGSTVTAFAAALADLAGDEAVSHVPQRPPVAAGPADVPPPSGQAKDELGAATNETITTITGWLTAGYRQKHLKKAISESAEGIRRVLTALEVVITEVYVETHLNQERANLVELFEFYDLDGPRDPVASSLRQLELQRRLFDLDSRLAKTKRLLARLERLALAHEHLVQTEGALGQKELLAEIRIALADTFATESLPPATAPLSVPRPAAETPPMPAAPPSTAANP